MANQNPIGNGGLTAKQLTEAHGHQTTPHAIHYRRPACGSCAERPAKAAEFATGLAAGKANRFDWQAVALWVFVAACFAAFVFVSCLLWAKCQRTSEV